MTLVTAFDSDNPDASIVFEATYISPERWNGAAKCWFAGIEAERIAEDCAVQPWSSTEYRWNESIDGFEENMNVTDPNEPDRWEAVPTMEIAGVKLFEMGQGWTWRELECPALDPEDEWSVEAREEWENLYRAVRDAQRVMSDIPYTEHHFARVAGK
jgi:hypothetical protein